MEKNLVRQYYTVHLIDRVLFDINMDHYICSAIDIHHYYNSNTFSNFYIS